MPPQQNNPQFSPPTLNAPAPRGSKSLPIALVVSAVLLLAAGGIAAWMIVKKNSGEPLPIVQNDPNDTTGVKSLVWEAPADLPTAYVKRSQSTQDIATNVYTDDSTVCSITTNVAPIGQQNGDKAKDVALKLAESPTIKTTANTEAPEITINDTDGTHIYKFSGMSLEQEVTASAISYNKLHGLIGYKQFDKKYVASIGYSCKAESWEAQKPALDEWVKKFTVKTER